MWNPFKPKRECKPLVKYQGRTLEFDASVGGGVFSLSDFKTEERTIQEASEVVQILDNLQVIMCRDYRGIPENDHRFDEYQKRRDRINAAMSYFRYALVLYQKDPANQKQAIADAFQDLRKVLVFENLGDSIEKTNERQYGETKSTVQEIIQGDASTRLQFYKKLADLLEISRRTFVNQIIVRDQLYNLLLEDKRFDIGGLEYEPMFAKFHDQMNNEQQRKFRFIRQITEDIAKYNQQILELLTKNHDFLADSPLLKRLEEHLEFWLSKYRALKDDPGTSLIYTEPEEGKGFPQGVDLYVSSRVKEGMN